MDLVLLKTFLKVVAFGNITKAAAVLFVTQSAVSRRIQQLESYVGQPLLERSGPALSPTEAGRLLVEKARRMLEIEQEIMESLGLARSRHKLSVCCTPSLGVDRLAGVFSSFVTSHAATVDLNCVFTMPEEALAGVDSGRFDMALIEHCDEVDLNGYHTYSLPDDEVLLVSAPSLEIAGGEITLEQVFSHRLYLKNEKGCAKRFMDMNLSRLGHTSGKFSGVVYFDDFPFLKEEVLAGRGVTFVSTGIVAGELRRGLLRAHRVQGFNHNRPRTMVLTRQQFPPHLIDFADTIFEAFGVTRPEQLTSGQ